ncbi:MAG: alpha/beta hydrolase [Sphingomonadaceae bacterium]|nr:alpha/beta hydrolase [Sphingomonadaceae bacterium]
MTPDCRKEIVQLCGTDRGAIRTCLREKASQLSEKCRADIRERLGQRGGEEKMSRAAVGATEMAYGDEPLQKLDFWQAKSERAPLVIFVHGGGWKRGDKRNATGQYKASHYTGQGYAFASINYRLVPDATVEQQAADVAAAVAYLRSNAKRLGIDSGRIVLMGHSAGAHLVALLGTDQQYLREAGLRLSDLSGVIPLDGAAYDVPAQMAEGAKRMKDTYVQAFGTDPARQKRLSPYWHASAPNAPAFLILHVEREDGARQSAALSETLRKNGTNVELRGFNGKGLMGHMEINRKLGDPNYPATSVVDAWLRQVFDT